LRAEGYASDPGDLGTGWYLTSCPATASNYGVVGTHQVHYEKAVRARGKDILDTIDLFYRTVRGRDRLAGADQMRADFLEVGVEAMVVRGYDSPGDHVTVVEFSSVPPRPVLVLEDETTEASDIFVP
jgi:hypothetical protein